MEAFKFVGGGEVLTSAQDEGSGPQQGKTPVGTPCFEDPLENAGGRPDVIAAFAKAKGWEIDVEALRKATGDEAATVEVFMEDLRFL